MSSFTKSFVCFVAHLFEYLVGKDRAPIDFGHRVSTEVQEGKWDDILLEAEESFLSWWNTDTERRKGILLEECNICMNFLANTRTSCNHWICGICWTRIKNNYPVENALCPFCRQPVTKITIFS
jgi:hypothetical protein